MDDLTVIIFLTKWAMYVTAVATWLLRFLVPSPEDFTGIFGVSVAPHKYLVFYNLMRWIAGNKSWVGGGESRKSTTLETTDLAGTKTTTTLTTERVQDQDRKTEEPKP